MRIYLANVGANKYHLNRHGLASPLFEDGKFEFLPILAGDQRTGDSRLDDSPNAIRYSDLRSHYDSDQGLSAYVPSGLKDKVVQNSPEFETFTYCDACGQYPRAKRLKHVERGDVLLFLAGLRRRIGGEWTDEYGLHLIGGFHIGETLSEVGEPPDQSASARFAKSAVMIWGLALDEWYSSDWIFGGSTESRRFNKAVPLGEEICKQVFRDANGNPWRWGPTKSGCARSALQVIGSYTRTARRMLDTSIPEEADRAAILRDWIARHTGEADAALLETK